MLVALRAQPAPQPGPEPAPRCIAARAPVRLTPARPHIPDTRIEDSAWPSTSFTTSTRAARPGASCAAHASRRCPASSPTTGEFIAREQRRGARVARTVASVDARRRPPAVAGHPQPAVRLPGRELPSAHDRVRHGPGRQALQHDLHQGAQLHRARRSATWSGRGRCSSSTTRSSSGWCCGATSPGKCAVTDDEPARVRRRARDRQRLLGARRADPADAVLQGQELPHLRPGRSVPLPARARATCRRSSACSSR